MLMNTESVLQMCICHIHNGHLCIYTDFLSKFVEEIIVDRAFSGHQGIDEDEVELCQRP